MQHDTVSEWRRMWRKYRGQGCPFWWCLKIVWQLERAGRKQRLAQPTTEARDG